MKSSQILDGLRLVAHEHLAYQGPLDPSTSLIEVLELDSLRMLTLVVEVENHFQVCLEDGDEQDLVTASDLVELIRRRLDENTD